MGTTTDARASGTERLRALDVTRLFAISMMFMAHWWGVVERFPGPHADVLAYAAKAATPGFVTVFGLTVGYAYWSVFVSRPGDLRAKLLARAAKTFRYALLVAVPGWAELARAGDWSAPAWIFRTYSVLMFYALAIPSMLVVLPLIRRRPAVLAPALAALLWIAGDVLRGVWPEIPRTLAGAALEYPRLVLVSGPYAYFNLMAIAVTFIPVGMALRGRVGDPAGRRAVFRLVAAGGAALCVGAMLVAAAAGVFSARDVISGAAKNPPRLWYFLHFGGMTICFFGLVGLAESAVGAVARAVRPLAKIGQSPLQVYAAHAFVLPATHLLAWASGLRTEVTFAIAFLAFAAYCASLARARPSPPAAIAGAV